MDSQCQSKVLIIYHRVDYDGMFSACIAKKYYLDNNYIVDLKGYNYGDQVPDFAAILGEYQQISILDVSFDPDIMKLLRDSGKAEWIDHHAGTTRLGDENGYSDFPGQRTDLKIGACEVAWDYFFKGMKTPHIIELISAYDVWDHDRFVWDLETLPLQYALRTKYSLNVKKLWRDWSKFINEEEQEYRAKLYDIGRDIMQYLKNVWKSWCGNYAFEVKVGGKYKGICILSAQGGSAQFESMIEDYPIQVVVNRKEPNLYNVGIYKTSDSILPEFDLSVYAHDVYKTGNGHKSAAGFTIDLEQFIKLVRDQEL